ncbi:TPA: tail fiber assembly protein, partial [Citrobacter freundii]
ERERAQLLAYADNVTADWRTELALGDISDTDKAKLSLWMAYKRDVKTVNAADAILNNFLWPARPE